MTASAIYTGSVRHRRMRELPRQFSYPVTLAYLDLDELPGLAGGRLVSPRPGPWRFRRRDYLGPADQPLAEAVRDRVAAALGERPAGPVRLLTQLRCFGMSFNPVSLYYCFEAGGGHLHSVVAEVTNTPWRERHAYVLGPWSVAEACAGSDAGTRGRVHRATRSKALHVSPFMGMDQRYEISLTDPGETLSLHISCEGPQGRDFDATLGLRRRAFSDRALSALVREDPLGPLRTLSRIYAQGFRLKFRGVPVHPHPTRGHA